VFGFRNGYRFLLRGLETYVMIRPAFRIGRTEGKTD